MRTRSEVDAQLKVPADAEALPGTTYSLTPASTTVTEANTGITFTVTRSGNLGAETIYASTLVGTASSSGGDYDGLTNLALSFTNNQTTRTFTVGVNEDSLVEGTEQFRVMIGATTGAGSSQALDISTVTINDDDAAASTFTLTPVSTTVSEGVGSITFTITRSSSSGSETVYFSTVQNQGFTNSGDYTGRDTVAVNFSPGDTTETITVSITNDTTPEGTETFGAIIENAAGTVLDSSTFTITDNDQGTTDTVRQDINTNATLSPGTINGTIDAFDLSGDAYDGDYYRVTLTAGRSYTFSASANASSSDTLDSVRIRLRDSNGNIMSPDPTDSGATPNFNFTASNGGLYFLAISAAGGSAPEDKTGAYTITLTDNGASTTDTVRQDINTTAVLSPGTINGTIDAFDLSGDAYDGDYYRVTLTQGRTYTFSASANVSGGDSLDSVRIRLRDSNGNIMSPDPTDSSATPSFTFTASSSGTYFLAISASGGAAPEDKTGAYTITLADNGAGGNAPPTISGPSSLTREINQTISFTSLITAQDSDGSVVQYRFSDTNPGAGYLTLDSVRISGTFVTVAAGQLNRVGYFTGPNAGSNAIAIEAIDDDGEASPNFLTTTINVTSPGQPGDTAGQSRATARDLGTLSGATQTVNESVGANDAADYFRIEVTQAGAISASISSMIADADLFLLSQGGAILDQSRASGSASDSVSYQVTAGVYYINVDSYAGDTTYQLQYAFTPGATTPGSGWSISTPGSVQESNNTISFIITRPPGLSEQTVYVSTTTDQGSANAQDYHCFVSVPYTFAEGQTTRTVTVQLRDDTASEQSETFGLIVQASLDDTFGDRLATATFTITDPDVAPPVSQQPSSQAIFETYGPRGDIGFLGTLALAAYRLAPGEVGNASGQELHSSAAGAHDTADQLLDLLDAGDLALSAGSIVNGIYTNDNAGALVGVSADGLFIAFRGTNDNDLGDAAIEDAWNGRGTADVDDWMSKDASDPEGMARHWLLFQPLINAIESYRATHGIQLVYVTGHSLGSAMAQRFMSTSLGNPIYRAVTFASPGFEDIADVADSRTITFNVDEDRVRWGSLLPDYGETGREIVIRHGSDVLVVDPPPSEHFHDPRLYQQMALLIARGGLNLNRNTVSLDYTNNGIWNVLYPHGTVTGSGDHDTLRSLSTADTLYGLEGNDFLYSGDGGDQVFGGPGFDFAVGGAGGGDDLYDGGADIDTLSYESTTQGVLINLSLAQDHASGAEIGIDQVISFENIIGGSGNDRIIGDGSANALSGGAGDDTLDGGHGNDTLNGDAGADTAIYAAARASYVVLSFGPMLAVLTSGADGRDRLSGVEQLQFSDMTIAATSAEGFAAFDYVATHADLLSGIGANAQGAFDHYVDWGFAEGRARDAFANFDYVASHADLVTSIGANAESAALHYVQAGFSEGRAKDTFANFEYLASNPDLILAFGADAEAAALHYVQAGFAEGRARDAFANFDYVASYGDLIVAFGANADAAAMHYVHAGFAEGRAKDTFANFDYIASHADLIPAVGANAEAAALHYIQAGFAEGRARDAFANYDYLASNTDLILAFGSNTEAAAQHYVEWGFGEGRARDSFANYDYLASNADLIGALGANTDAAVEHYVKWGFAEGRAKDTFANYDYVASHTDLIAAIGANADAAAEHYVRWGHAEGRAADTFDAAQYLANYADLQAAYGSDELAATLHFIQWGYYEGRIDDPLMGG